MVSNRWLQSKDYVSFTFHSMGAPFMIIWWHEGIFCITGPSWGSSIADRWIPLTDGLIIGLQGLYAWCHTRGDVILGRFTTHDDVIKWKHFPRNWPFAREIHRSPVNFPHKGQWRGTLMFSLIYAWINDWVNNREAGDLRRQHGHYDVIVMKYSKQHRALLINFFASQ